MTDSYQPIYDAVRSRIHGANIGDAVHSAIREANLGHYVMLAADEARWAINRTFDQATRPSVLFRPEITIDGTMYCALYGADLMSGCAGFGETVEAAMLDFDKNWKEQTLASSAATLKETTDAEPKTLTKSPTECDHARWTFEKQGRQCFTCGATMVDWGD